MRWLEINIRERRFEVEHAGQIVPGVLWTPEGATGPRPLILAGHGLTMNRRALFPLTLAHDLVTQCGFAVAAIDAPGHGDRQPDGGRDAIACEEAWRTHWRACGATQIAAEYRAVLDKLLRSSEIDAPAVGYWGLSLATQYGLGVLAEEARIEAAVLGLSGLWGPRIESYAGRVGCAVFFIQQLDDEVCPPEKAEALFDRLATGDKTLRASLGRHMQVPGPVFEQAYAFLEGRLSHR